MKLYLSLPRYIQVAIGSQNLQPQLTTTVFRIAKAQNLQVTRNQIQQDLASRQIKEEKKDK